MVFLQEGVPPEASGDNLCQTVAWQLVVLKAQQIRYMSCNMSSALLYQHV
jgi:hypothetical protein